MGSKRQSRERPVEGVLGVGFIVGGGGGGVMAGGGGMSSKCRYQVNREAGVQEDQVDQEGVEELGGGGGMGSKACQVRAQPGDDSGDEAKGS